jgi:hypothetical protein
MSAQRLIGAAAIVLVSMGAMAQTHTEMLEKGIFTEETAGDLAGAIRIYESLSSEAGVPREVAVRARARLTEARQRQQRPSQPGVVAAHAAPAGAAQDQTAPRLTPSEAVARQVQAVNSCCGLFSGNYDPGRPVNVTGTVTRVELINPQSVVYVKGDDGRSWGFTLAAPNTMIRSGWNRTTLSPGQQVSVSGFLATGTGECAAGQVSVPSGALVVGTPPLPHACAVLLQGHGTTTLDLQSVVLADLQSAVHASAGVVTVNGTTIFERFSVEMKELERLQEAERQARERAAQ